MAKLPHQSTVPPVDDQDDSTKVYVDVSGGSSALQPVSPTCLEVVDDFNSNNAVEIGDVAAEAGGLGLQGPAFTLEGWFKPGALGSRHAIIARGRTDAGLFGTTFTVTDSEVRINGRRSGGSVNFAVAHTLVLSEWNHYAVSRLASTGNTIIYINGLPIGSSIQGAGTEMFTETGLAFVVGGDTRATGGGDQADGRIFEARKWNVERTAAEILANYRSTLAGDETGLNGYWRFDGDFTDSTAAGNDLAAQAGASPLPVANIVDAPFATRSASSLESKGGLIDVASASAPTVGQRYTADGAGGGSWQTPTGGGAGSDTTAIHDDTAGEINAVALKATPVEADVILIEDSADSFNKKKATLTDLIGGGGGSTAGVSFNAQSAEFEASSSQHANAGDVTFFDGLTALTVEMWVNPESLPPNGGFCGKSSNLGGQITFQMKQENGGIRLYLSSDGGFGTVPVWPTLAMPLNDWTHVAITWDGVTGDCYAYKNGVQHDTVKAGTVGALFNGNLDFVIGRSNNAQTHWWDGGMSELRIWGAVRTVDQIADNMFRAIASDSVDLVAQYHLDGDFTEAVAGADATGVNAPTFTNEVPFNSDANAIHTNVAGEIDALILKATPVAADLLAIEDSAASFAKKKITLTDLLVGGSSGPIAAAQGDYLVATLSADQNNVVSAGTPIAFDRVDDSRGDGIALDVTTNVGRLTLAAGRTYLLAFRIHFGTSSGAARLHQLWNVTDNVAVPGGDTQIWNASAAGTVGGPQGLTIPVAPLVDTEYEMRFQGSADTDYSQDWTGFTVTEIGAVQADVVGGLEFMDIINVSVATPLISFGEGGDGVFQRAMDGNVDDTYVVDFGVVLSGSNDVSIRPNGVSTNQEGRRYTGGSSLGNPVAYMIITDPSGPGDTMEGSIELRAAVTRGGVAQRRTYRSTHHTYDVSGDDSLPRGAAGRWNNTVDNIVSLDVAVETSGNFEPGTYAILWRKTQTNLRADSAAVYERMSMETVDPGALVTTERTVGHAIYGGSIVGVSARVEDAVTAGSITVNVKADGVTKLTAVLDTTNSTSRVVRAEIGQQTFAADENISVEFVPSAYDNAGSIASAVTVQVHMTNSGLITQNDRVVSKTVLGANATTLSVTGLNGDLDGTYEIEGTIFLTTSANNLLLAPNGDTSNLKSAQSANGAFTSSADGKIVISAGVSTRNEFNFRCLAYVSRTKNGVTRIRSFQFTASHTFDTATNVNTFISNVAYEDGAANLTGLDFTCSVASGILAGSEVIVRRVKA
jgi:hypothetical protein